MNVSPNDDILQALERFVIDNEELLELEERIGKFNIFDALAISRRELQHSNFLSFILDPAESHGHSQLFLKAVLMDLLKSAPRDARPLSPIEIDGADLEGVEVRREWQNIDLLITCRKPEFVVAIENKIDSSEHSDQLCKYKTIVNQHFPQLKALFVYLTPNKEQPSETGWTAYSYPDLFRVLARVRKTYSGSIGDDVSVFLEHYLSLIGTRFMDDPETNALCERIWKNHRRAIQLIYDRVGNPASPILSEVEEIIRQDNRWHVYYRTGELVDFVPKEWIDWLPPIGTDRKDCPQSWVVFRFSYYKGKLSYIVEVRKINDLQLRRQIIDALISNAPKLGFCHKHQRSIKDSYTRVSANETIMKFREEDEVNLDSIGPHVKKRLSADYPRMNDIAEVLKQALSLYNK